MPGREFKLLTNGFRTMPTDSSESLKTMAFDLFVVVYHLAYRSQLKLDGSGFRARVMYFDVIRKKSRGVESHDRGGGQ